MAINLGDNINYKGTKPDFVRQQYDTKAEMAAVVDTQLPRLYFGWCLEDEKLYLYNKGNPVDPELGKWRLFTSENAFQVTEMPVASALYAGQCIQYLGDTTVDYEHGYMYECVLDTDTGNYIWQSLNFGGEVESIPAEDIENLFD